MKGNIRYFLDEKNIHSSLTETAFFRRGQSFILLKYSLTL
jgi:hypothetical protein